MASDLEESLTKLFDSSGDKFRINSVSTFSYKERDAHKWDENIVKQYFTAKLDLLSYGDVILKNRINGAELLSIDETFPHPAFKFQNQLHSLKVLSHVKDTRQRVIEYGKKTRPANLTEWEVSHVASWLHVEQGNEKASLIALRNQWTGITLLDIDKHHGAARGWSNIPSESQPALLTAVQNLISTHQTKPKESAETGKKKNKKHLTAIQKRAKASLASSEDETDHISATVPTTNPETAITPITTAKEAVKIAEEPLMVDSIPDQAANGGNDQYHFRRPTSSPKNTKLKNKLKKITLDENIALLPHIDQNIELELQQSKKEREKFHEKLSFLHNIVEEHSTTINKLRLKSEQLQREKELALLDFATLTSNSHLQSRLITTLTKDRDLAVQEVEKITRLFHQHAEIQKAEYTQNIDKLSMQVVQSKQKVATIKHTHNTTALVDHSPVANAQQLADFSMPKPVRENADVSLDFLSTASLKVQKVKVENDGDGDSDLEGALDVAMMAASTNNQQQPQSPRQASSLLLPPSAAAAAAQSLGAGSTAAAGIAGGASVLELMQKSTLQTQQNWSTLFQTFIWPKPSASSTGSILALAGDTRQLLLQIACKWIKLGRWMLASAHSTGSNSSTSSIKYSSKTLSTLASAARGLLLKMVNFNPNSHSSFSSPDFAETSEEIEKSKDIIFDVNAEAVAIVFAMAAVHRRLSQNSDTNSSNKAVDIAAHSNNTSDLQITHNLKEISRENLRKFLAQHLSIVVPWDRFDALLQRIDLNRKGFVQLPDFLHAFLGVHPLAPSKGVNKEVHGGGGSSATLSSTATPVHLSLPRQYWSMAVSLLLTIATDEIISCARPLSEFWLTILTRPTTCKSSAVRFARYLTHVQEQVTKQRRSKAELILLEEALENAEQKNNNRVSIQQEAESKLVHDQALITGLLQELTFKPINNHLKPLMNQLTEAKSLVKYSDKEKRPEIFDNKLLQQVLRFICYRHEELCQFVAHGLGIYDSTVDDDILTAFSTLFTPFLHMRSACQPPAVTTTTASKEEVTVGSISDHKKSTFAQHLEQWLRENPTVHIPITPTANTTQTSSTLAANILSNRVEVDYQVCELLGFPLLHILQQHSTPVHSLQMTVEQMMVDLKMIEFDLHIRHGSTTTLSTTYNNSNSINNNNRSVSPASPSKKLEQKRLQTETIRSEALLDIQRTLHRELWDHSKQFQPRTQQHVKEEEKAAKPQPLPHVVSEVNTVLAQQRIEHVTAYLESLNVKAQKKKHILQTLLSLWQSAKVMTSNVNATTTMSKQKQREVSMPISEIITQTKSIQAVLLKDMQATPNTRIAHLEAKTELLRKGMQTGVIIGEDEEGEETLRKALLEVDSMKASLLLANNDAMRLAARILQQLQENVEKTS